MEALTLPQLNSSDRIKAINSQKAKALFTHRSAHTSYSVPQDWEPLDMVVIHLTDTTLHLTSAGTAMGYPCFLRACPESPRHGVIESIRCNDEASLLKNFTYLSGVMKREDPDGCMILMPFINASSSSVMALSHPEVDEHGNPVMYDEVTGVDANGNSIVKAKPVMFQGYNIMGVGHDGITAGHGLNLAFPLRTDSYTADNMIMCALSYAPTHHELEFVYRVQSENRDRGPMDLPGMKHNLTQIRSAPSHTPVHPPPEGVDTIGMIPQGEVVIQDFIVMSGLEEVAWLEENITAEKCPDGYIVVEPSGSRLSHIYAHCRGVGVAYAITPSVTVGDRWVEAAPGWVVMDNENKFVPKPYQPSAFIDDFKRGVEMGNKYWRKQQGWFSTFFHQWVSLPMSKPQDVAFLAGMFCAWLPKAILALGLGEMRHARSLKTNANAELFATMTACVGSKVWQKVNKTPCLDSSRGHYYAAIGHIELDWGDAAKMLRFLNKHYQKGWSSSYGGPKWGDAMVLGATLCDTLQEFMSTPDAETMGDLIISINKAENAVHNNGALFNKWLSKYAFDAGTTGFNPRRDMDAMSSTFEMAREFLDDELVDVRAGFEAASPPENDWGSILDYVEKKTPAYWRKTPMASSKNVHEALREVMSVLPVGWRHGDKGSHNNPSNKDFVMCGVSTCQTCIVHLDWGTKNPDAITSSVLIELKHLFDEHSASLMITPPALDVWLVGSIQETRASVKVQVALIKAKEFEPTAKEFVAIYEAIDPTDPETPDMMLVLNKWLAKKGDGLEQFLDAMSKTDEVTTQLKMKTDEEILGEVGLKPKIMNHPHKMEGKLFHEAVEDIFTEAGMPIKEPVAPWDLVNENKEGDDE